MKPRKYSRILLLVAVIASLFLSSCQPQSTTVRSASQPGTELRVGITANAPPFAFKQAGTITGLEPAFAALLGEYLGKKVTLVEVPWEKQFDFLNSGKTDIIMSGMTITRQRLMSVNFSKPYMRSGQIMLVHAKDRQLFARGIESLMNKNYRIGTVTGTASDLFISATINGANEIPFKEPQEAVNALIAHDIDTFVYDAPVVCYYAASHQQQKLLPVMVMGTEEYLGWAVRKNDTELLARLNQFVDHLDGQGTLRQEIDYWIPYFNR